MSNFSSELDKITEEYYNIVYAYCLSRMRNVDEAMEITQTVFLSLCKNYKNGKINNAERWLMKTAQNQVAQYLRDKYKKQSMYISEEIDDERINASYNPFEEISEEEIENILNCVIDSLTTEEHYLYESYYGKNKVDKKVLADTLKISEPTLRKRLSRLKSKIIAGIKGLLYCFIIIGFLFK